MSSNVGEVAAQGGMLWLIITISMAAIALIQQGEYFWAVTLLILAGILTIVRECIKPVLVKTENPKVDNINIARMYQFLFTKGLVHYENASNPRCIGSN